MGDVLKGYEVALPRLPPDWHLQSLAILADSKLAILASNIDIEHEWRRDKNQFAPGQPFEAADRAEGRLWCFDGETLAAGPVFPLETPFLSKVDRFKDGRWLIAGSRSSGEPNARVLGPDGRLLARFMLGDGISRVGVDRLDQIWVGWFDEGIFGNRGWRVPGEEWPPSSRGIGVFSADGTYQLSALSEGSRTIDDCYALNVSDEGVWVCPYMDFPLLHVRHDHPVRWWSNELAGPRALAVFQGHVLLAGGYGAEANRLALLELDGEGNGNVARHCATWQLPLVPRMSEQGETPDVAKRRPWQWPTLLGGRQDVIHLVVDGMWHRWRVSDGLIAADLIANSAE